MANAYATKGPRRGNVPAVDGSSIIVFHRGVAHVVSGATRSQFPPRFAKMFQRSLAHATPRDRVAYQVAPNRLLLLLLLLLFDLIRLMNLVRSRYIFNLLTCQARLSCLKIAIFSQFF